MATKTHKCTLDRSCVGDKGIDNLELEYIDEQKFEKDFGGSCIDGKKSVIADAMNNEVMNGLTKIKKKTKKNKMSDQNYDLLQILSFSVTSKKKKSILKPAMFLFNN